MLTHHNRKTVPVSERTIKLLGKALGSLMADWMAMTKEPPMDTRKGDDPPPDPIFIEESDLWAAITEELGTAEKDEEYAAAERIHYFMLVQGNIEMRKRGLIVGPQTVWEQQHCPAKKRRLK